jgi:hypothetical protein
LFGLRGEICRCRHIRIILKRGPGPCLPEA